jgi:5'-3' exonuclease
VLPEQYADFAPHRGDASDGLPGVAGIGEKTAASLLGEYGTLAALREAAADDDADLSASVRGKLVAASDYLDVAPTVVAVVRDLDLPSIDDVGARLRPVAGDDRDALEALGEEWNLGGSLTRFLAALDARR